MTDKEVRNRVEVCKLYQNFIGVGQYTDILMLYAPLYNNTIHVSQYYKDHNTVTK